MTTRRLAPRRNGGLRHRLLSESLFLFLSASTLAAGGCRTTRPNQGPPQGGNCDGGTNSEEVRFLSADGLVVYGTAVRPCGIAVRPVVVLAHQLCQDRREWSRTSQDWVSGFATRGVATLAIDLRGHGQSTLWPDGSRRDLCSGNYPDADYAGMVDDVRAAVAYARSALGASAVALVGASIGSNSSLVAYGGDAALRMVVALSPGLDYRGIQPSSAVSAYGTRPALLEAASDDPYSADSVRQLGQANANVTTQIFPSGGHGNALIATHPEELVRVLDLVTSRLTAR
jgi:alpha/beta superfamily hydrolase